MRVLEWKRRQTEGCNEQKDEGHTLGQKGNPKEKLDAVRQLAAARAEDVERRLVRNHVDKAGRTRAAEMTEKWAKSARIRERRRAEIYAINAVMR